MNIVQKRKFTLALNGFLRAKKLYEFSWGMRPKMRSRRNANQLIRRQHLYEVVDELTKGSK